MAVVIYTEKEGVYLGNFLGLSFWSKLDPVGQPEAVTFPDEATAKEHIAEWLWQPTDVRFVGVDANPDGYASVAACVRAGLPGWIDEQTPVANALPA